MRAGPSRRARPCVCRCKLCDFGLAHAYDLDPSGAVVRAPLKEVCGSKSYCAPEVLAGLGYDGGFADMWSLVRPTPRAPRPSAPRPAVRRPWSPSQCHSCLRTSARPTRSFSSAGC